MNYPPPHSQPEAQRSFATGGTNVRRVMLAPFGALCLLACIAVIAFFVFWRVQGGEIPRFALLSMPGAVLSVGAIVYGIAWNLRMRRVRAAFERTVRALHARVMVPGEWSRWYWQGAWPITGQTDDVLSAALEVEGTPVFVDLRPFPDLDRFTPALVVLASGRLAPDAARRLASPELGPLYQRLIALGFVVEVHPSGLGLRGTRDCIARVVRTGDLSVLHEAAAYLARLTAFVSLR